MAVKDFSQTPSAFRRWVAPYLIRRETNVLKHLQGVPGVPRYFGRIDHLAFAMEYIEGTPIANFKQGELAPEVFGKIQHIIDAIHAIFRQYELAEAGPVDSSVSAACLIS